MVNKKICCGCGACAQICPRNCITMTADAEGFLYPVINQEKCVQCGLCEAACPVNGTQKKTAICGAYVAHSTNEETRCCSSSGGTFSVMAKWILEQQGVVFGAAFVDDFSICHIKVDRLENLQRICGSKYVQSSVQDTYKQAKAALSSGQTVLFSGTGCQIAGLRAYLQKDYDNLYTVDVLCHGVPSPMAWQYYLQEKKKVLGGEVTDVSFRDKCSGWNNYSIRITASNGAQYRQPFRKDAYMKCFINDLSLRPSCYECKFKGYFSVSDVMLSDAWGVEARCPDRNDNKGTSMVLIHTQKGQRLWDAVSKDMLAQPVDAGTFLKDNPVFWNPAEKRLKRKAFFQKIKKKERWSSLEQLCPRSFLERLLSKGRRGVRKISKRINHNGA